MRLLLAVPAWLALLCPNAVVSVAAQSANPAGHEHADHGVQGGGTLPAGWSARPDAKGDLRNIKFETRASGFHLTLGPATILYRDRNRAKGPFHTLATFTQTRKLEHSEGYGLFFGGRALTGTGQAYVYFLVRDDGKYLIKRRDGEKTTEITKGWTAHPSVKKADAQGVATNLLEIDAKRDPRRIGFKVNGQEVYSSEDKSMKVKGMIGIRANHNLDLQIDGFDVHQ